MTTRFERRLTVAAAVILLAVGSRGTAAQSAGQLGAWEGLTLSPVGALAPVARDPGDIVSGVHELTLRYGRWRYDADDAVHDNIGLMWSHSIGFAKTKISVTGVYELVECPTCSAWRMGGVDLQSTVWDHGFAVAAGRTMRTAVGLRLSVGGAQYLGAEASTSASAAITMPIDIALPLMKSSVLCASIVPGFGYGRISSTDLAESGVLPMIGAALAWTITTRLGVDLGMQRVIITGGPIQIGAAVSLKLGSLHHVQP